MICIKVSDSGTDCLPYKADIDMQGTLVEETAQDYVVNFNREAHKQMFIGNYTRVVISKSKCVKDR